MLFKKINKELQENIDQAYKQNCHNFFTEKIDGYGVRTPVVRKIAKRYFVDVKDLSKKYFLNICEEFLKTNYNEDTTIAIQWLRYKQKELTEKDFLVLEKFLKRYMNNWAKIDDYCTHVINPFLSRCPIFKKHVICWTLSKNYWLRRASAVSLISNKKEFYTKENVCFSFTIAKKLLKDKEDLVQKGYGWLLKVISKHYPQKVFEFVMLNKTKMPRTALRYAIENLNQDFKKKAMSK